MDEKDAFNQLQFLYERRMVLFNTRRDHEWKILFGVIGLLIALDAAQLGYGVQLVGWHRYAWVGWGLQRRNVFDRPAMNAIYNTLCRDLSLHSRWSGLWAFLPQMLFLFVVALISASLPWLGLKTPKSP